MRLLAANKRVARSLCPGVISALLLDIKYSPSSLDKSSRSYDYSPDLEAIVEEACLLFGMLSSFVTGNGLCLAQYSYSTYFRKRSWYWVV